MSELRLVRPTVELEQPFLEMVVEYMHAGENRFDPFPDDFEDYVDGLRRWERGVDLEAGYVPMTVYWLLEDGVPVGVGQLRHRLTPALEVEGGHIGYDIRPSARRRGLGTKLLAMLLTEARERGIERALLTCDADNEGSRKIIERNGGEFVGTSRSPRSGKPVLKYSVPTQHAQLGR